LEIDGQKVRERMKDWAAYQSLDFSPGSTQEDTKMLGKPVFLS
jgi:hypothetical protein